MIIYFAHPIKTYGTPREARAMKLIKERFPDAQIIDPSIYTTDPRKFKFKHFLIRVKKCDLLIFMPFFGHVIGKGIYDELMFAKKEGKKILYLNLSSGTFWKKMNLIRFGKNDWQKYAMVVFDNEFTLEDKVMVASQEDQQERA